MPQTVMSNLMVSLNTYQKGVEVDLPLLRHMILNSVRSYRSKFGDKFGELVLCYDTGPSWRREKFPYYKANRKKTRDASQLDWKTIFSGLNKIKDELEENFPYVVLAVPTAEADDIIAIMVKEKKPEEKCLIISGDKDFIQLHDYDNVEQYSPVQKKMIKSKNPALYLVEHIIRGDTSDGIPNFLSEDACLVEGKRQKPVYQKKVDAWLLQAMMDQSMSFLPEDLHKRYDRNMQLIDLAFVPWSLHAEVVDLYFEKKKTAGDRSKLFNYFIKHRLKLLLEVIGDF